MIASQGQEEERLSVNPVRARWLPLLEEELRDRIGWADEAVSPFARASRATDAEADLPRAA